MRLLGDFCVMRATAFSGTFEERVDAIIELLYDFYCTFDLYGVFVVGIVWKEFYMVSEVLGIIYYLPI